MRQELGPAGVRMAVLRHFTHEHLTTDEMIPVIIQFHKPAEVVYRAEHPEATEAEVAAYADQLRADHQQFIQSLRGLGMDARISTSRVHRIGQEGAGEVEVPHDFTYCFNGVGLLLPGRMIPQVAVQPEVAAITYNRERIYLNLTKSVPFTGAPHVWRRIGPDGLPLMGHGVVIAVIDTGVDWTHPAFGGFAQVPNEKVVFAASYTGEPPADNFGHGTHVAGICAGDMDYKVTPRGASRIQGVAPKAKLMSYKVLTAYGSGSATSIVMAIEDAVRRGAHVLNLSLGDPSGDPLSPEAVTANNAMRAGVLVVAAAGNSGPGPGTVGTPGAARYIITAGASTDPGVTALFARLAGEPGHNLEMRLMSGSVALPAGGVTARYVHCGLGTSPGDFPAAVQGRIALIRRGGNTFKEKAKLAQAAGAVAAIIFNNGSGNFFGTLGDASPENPHPDIPVISISREDGEYLLGREQGEDGAFRPALFLDPTPVPQPNRMAEFSSRGPTHDHRIKPDLTAPGVDIASATILPEMAPGMPGISNMADPSGYTSTSGTSMATPHIVGACALLKQAHPDWDAFTIKAVLMNTARWMDGQGGVLDQGAGRLDLQRAVAARGCLVTDGAPPEASHSFGVVAHGGGRVELRQGFRVMDLTGAGPGACRVEVVWLKRAPGLRAYRSAQVLKVPRNSCATFEIRIKVNGGQVPDGTYYGLIRVTGDWGTMHLPFMLVARGQGPSVPSLSDPAEAPAAPQPSARRWG